MCHRNRSRSRRSQFPQTPVTHQYLYGRHRSNHKTMTCNNSLLGLASLQITHFIYQVSRASLPLMRYRNKATGFMICPWDLLHQVSSQVRSLNFDSNDSYSFEKFALLLISIATMTNLCVCNNDRSSLLIER